MKTKHITWASLLLFLVLVIGAYLLETQYIAKLPEARTVLLPNLEIKNIYEIEFSQNNKSIVLEKRTDIENSYSEWKIGKPIKDRANQRLAIELCRKLTSAKILRTFRGKELANKSTGLQDDSALEATIKYIDAEKNQKDLKLKIGLRAAIENAVYVMISSDRIEKNYIHLCNLDIGNLFVDKKLSPKALRDYNLCGFDTNNIIAATHKMANAEVKISRENAESQQWRMEIPMREEIPADEVENFFAKLLNIKVEEIISEENALKLGLSFPEKNPRLYLQFEGQKTHQALVIKIVENEKKDAIFARISNRNGIFRLDNKFKALFLPNTQTFLKDKIIDAQLSKITNIRLSDVNEDNAIYFHKNIAKDEAEIWNLLANDKIYVADNKKLLETLETIKTIKFSKKSLLPKDANPTGLTHKLELKDSDNNITTLHFFQNQKAKPFVIKNSENVYTLPDSESIKLLSPAISHWLNPQLLILSDDEIEKIEILKGQKLIVLQKKTRQNSWTANSFSPDNDKPKLLKLEAENLVNFLASLKKLYALGWLEESAKLKQKFAKPELRLRIYLKNITESALKHKLSQLFQNAIDQGQNFVELHFHENSNNDKIIYGKQVKTKFIFLIPSSRYLDLKNFDSN